MELGLISSMRIAHVLFDLKQEEKKNVIVEWNEGIRMHICSVSKSKMKQI